MSHLWCALDDVLGGRGRLVVLAGRAGTGKSARAAGLREVAEAACLRWVEARCTPCSADRPYGLARDLLRNLLGLDASATVATVRAHLTAALSAAEPAPSARARLRLVGPSSACGETPLAPSERIELLAHLLAPKPMDGGPSACALRNAARDLVLAAAARQPLVLNLEDVHWADGESLELAGAIAESLAQRPLLLLVQTRPAANRAWFAGGTVLRLEPTGPPTPLDPVRERALHHRRVGELLERHLGATPDAGQLARVALHFGRSDDDARAAQYAMAAGDAAAAELAHDTALRWYDRADDALARLGDAWQIELGSRLLESRAMVETALGRYGPAEAHLRAAFAALSSRPADDPSRRRLPDLCRRLAELRVPVGS